MKIGSATEAVADLGGLDIMVNNAAYHCQTESLADIGEEQLDRTFRTNVYSYFWITQAALPHLEEGSVILNTGSVVALRGSPELLDYAATKGAVHVLTRSLATALSDRGVRVNCVAPGPVWTPLIASTKKEEEWRRPADRNAILQQPELCLRSRATERQATSSHGAL